MEIVSSAISTVVVLWSVLFPSKQWFAPDQAVNVTVKPTAPVTLMLTDFEGKAIDAKGSADVTAEKVVDVKALFPAIADGGTYILYSVPKGKTIAEFEGTPLVIEARMDKHPGLGGLNVICIRPLSYVVMNTDKGDMTMAFYYDVAPNTVDNFLTLTSQGFYDGLTFHRIVPGFVIQGGDPRGDGTGDAGYKVGAEFNNRPHEEGVLSMARSQHPDSAGTQFFICLDYKQTQQLDHQYTAFGKVTDGADVYKAIAKVPTGEQDKPTQPQVIKKAEVKAVTKDHNPYATLLKK